MFLLFTFLSDEMNSSPQLSPVVTTAPYQVRALAAPGKRAYFSMIIYFLLLSGACRLAFIYLYVLVVVVSSLNVALYLRVAQKERKIKCLCQF